VGAALAVKLTEFVQRRKLFLKDLAIECVVDHDEPCIGSECPLAAIQKVDQDNEKKKQKADAEVKGASPQLPPNARTVKRMANAQPNLDSSCCLKRTHREHQGAHLYALIPPVQCH
jgi:hypothetical protein